MPAKVFFLGFIFLFLQVSLFNHLSISNFYTPFVYLISIFFLPLKTKKISVILYCFCLGFLMDIVSRTGGVHMLSCLILGYLRPLILSITFGYSYSLQGSKSEEQKLKSRLPYLSLLILTHHVILHIFDTFDFKNVFLLIKNIIVSSIISIVFCYTICSIITSRR